MKLKFKFNVDEVTSTNIIYPKEIMKKALEEFVNSDYPLVTFEPTEATPEINMEQVIGKVKTIVINEDNSIEADIDFIKDKFNIEEFENALNIEGLTNRNIVGVSISGMGTIDKNENGNYLITDDYKVINLFVGMLDGVKTIGNFISKDKRNL